MPYTNAWSDIRPPGTELARNIDDEIRALRLDVHERMDAVVADWTADPVVPLASIPSYQFLISPAQLFSDSTLGNISNIWTELHAGDPRFFAQLSPPVKVGEKIIKVEVRIDRRTVPTFTVEIDSTTFDGVHTPAIEFTMATSAGGDQLLDSGPIAITLDAAKVYTLFLDQGASGSDFVKFYGARITVGP
jgi:hypothetical protein